MRLVAQSVPGTRDLETNDGRKLAGVNALAVFAVVGVHLEDAADALALVLGGVVDVRAGLEAARVNAEVRELADIRVHGDLESESRERLVVAGQPGDFFAVGPDARHGRHIQRRRQVLDDGVQQRLHAFVLEARAAEHRGYGDIQSGLTYGLPQLGRRDLVALKVRLHDGVVVICDALNETAAILLGQAGQLGRNVYDVPARAEFVAIDDGVHLDQVDDPVELRLTADRQLQRQGMRAEAVDHHLQTVEEVGPDTIHLVDVADARDAVLVRLMPHGLRLGLDTSDRTEEGYGSVQHAQAALHLDGEVHMTGSVDDVDGGVVPTGSGGGRRNGDAALLLLGHPVHDGGALVDLSHLVRLARVIQDALGGRGLTGIDVSHNADIARVFQRVQTHSLTPWTRRPDVRPARGPWSGASLSSS